MVQLRCGGTGEERRKNHPVARRKDLSTNSNYLRGERALVQWTLIQKKKKGAKF